MRVYSLTNVGIRASKSIRSEDTASWRVIYHLSGVGRATKDELTDLGATPSDLARLQRPPALIQQDNI